MLPSSPCPPFSQVRELSPWEVRQLDGQPTKATWLAKTEPSRTCYWPRRLLRDTGRRARMPGRPDGLGRTRLGRRSEEPRRPPGGHS